MMELPKLNFASASDDEVPRSVKMQEAQKKKCKTSIERGIAAREADIQSVYDYITNVVEANESDTDNIYSFLLRNIATQQEIDILKHMHAQLF